MTLMSSCAPERTLSVVLGDDGVERLDPWPFAAAEVEVTVPTRTIPFAGYADDAALQRAIADARAEALGLVRRAEVEGLS